MGNFGRRDKFNDRPRSGNDRSFGRNERSERPTMHQATCSDCGTRCEVPFKPTGSKPVFCSDCFSNQEGGGRGDRNDRFERRPAGRSSFGDKPKFKAVCDKCHQSCEVPFRPSGDKPIFCSDCFGKDDKGASERRNTGGSNQHKHQFEMLEKKLDTIISMLSAKTPKKGIAKEEKVISEVVVKTEKKEDKKEVPAKKEKAVSKKVVAKKKTVAPKKVVKKAVPKKKK